MTLWVVNKVLLVLFIVRRGLLFSLFDRVTHFTLLDRWALTDVGIGLMRLLNYLQ